MSEATKRFKCYTIEAFENFIDTLPALKRNITHIQIHHTWKPRHSDYQGEATILSMWRYHTQEKGWSNIGQHFSVAPNGLIWDGRPLDFDPAGISGHNEGGLMFEMIGNFDKGEDKLEGKQLEAIIKAVKICMKRFKLNTTDIVFHREYSAKTCPGSAISKEWFVGLLKEPLPVKPNWKQEAMDWLFEEGFLTDESWKEKIDEPVPLWLEAILLQRIYNKLKS